jgi:hypothetical protein
MHILHAKELTMHTDLNLATTSLKRGQMQREQDARGSLVQCLSGTLWLTQQGDARDIVLEAGDEARIEHDGLSILIALSEARFVLTRRNARQRGETLTAPGPSAPPAWAAT